MQNTLLRCLIVTWLASVCGVVWALGFCSHNSLESEGFKGVVGVPQLTYPYYIYIGFFMGNPEDSGNYNPYIPSI